MPIAASLFKFHCIPVFTVGYCKYFSWRSLSADSHAMSVIFTATAATMAISAGVGFYDCTRGPISYRMFHAMYSAKADLQPGLDSVCSSDGKEFKVDR